MTVACDENIQKWNCTVLFKFNGEFDVCMTVDYMTEKLNISKRSQVRVNDLPYYQ